MGITLKFKPRMYETKQFGEDGLKSISLDEVLKGINLPGTKNHRLEYSSVLEIEPPKSQSPKDISEFLKETFENHYPLSKEKINKIVHFTDRRGIKQKYSIHAVYPDHFNKLETFSATITFEYD